MDELEKHIKSIRDEIDIREPGLGLWNRIEAGLPGRQRSLRSNLWRAAAAVIVAGAALAVIAGMLRTSERFKDPQVTEVQETYRYYDDKIRSLYEEAEPLMTKRPRPSSAAVSPRTRKLSFAVYGMPSSDPRDRPTRRRSSDARASSSAAGLSTTTAFRAVAVPGRS